MSATIDHVTSAPGTGPVRRRPTLPTLPLLPQRVRKLTVVLHVVSSVSWLGLSLGNLVLAATGLTTGDPTTQHAVYLTFGVLGDTLLIPISLTALGTGLALSLFTRWGLFRHRWVVVKLVLTLVAVLLTPLSLLPGVHETVAVVQSTPAGRLADVGRDGQNLLVAACVSSSMYLTCVVLSVFKPSGRRPHRR